MGVSDTFATGQSWNIAVDGSAYVLTINSCTIGSFVVLEVEYTGPAVPSAPVGWELVADIQVLVRNSNNNPGTGGGVAGGTPVRLAVFTRTSNAEENTALGITYTFGFTDPSGHMVGTASGYLNGGLVDVIFGPTGDSATIPAISTVDQLGALAVGSYVLRVRGYHTHDLQGAPGITWTDGENGDFHSEGLGVAFSWSSVAGLGSAYSLWTHSTLFGGSVIGGLVIPHWQDRDDVLPATEFLTNGVSGPYDVTFAPTVNPPLGSISQWLYILISGEREFIELDEPVTPSCRVRATLEPGEIPAFSSPTPTVPGETEFTVGTEANIYEIQVGLLVDHPAVGEIAIGLETPSGTRVPVYYGGVGSKDFGLGEDSNTLAWFHATGFINPARWWDGESPPELDEISELFDYWGPYFGNYKMPQVFSEDQFSDSPSEAVDVLGEPAGGTWKLFYWDFYEEEFDGTINIAVVRICLDVVEDVVARISVGAPLGAQARLAD